MGGTREIKKKRKKENKDTTSVVMACKIMKTIKFIIPRVVPSSLNQVR